MCASAKLTNAPKQVKIDKQRERERDRQAHTDTHTHRQAHTDTHTRAQAKGKQTAGKAPGESHEEVAKVVDVTGKAPPPRGNELRSTRSLNGLEICSSTRQQQREMCVCACLSFVHSLS